VLLTDNTPYLYSFALKSGHVIQHTDYLNYSNPILSIDTNL